MAETKVSSLSQRQYATLDACAEMLSVSIKTVRRMISAGEITGYRVGSRQLRVVLSEVESAVVQRVEAA